MTDWDITPRVARRLRNLVSPGAPEDDPEVETQPDTAAAATGDTASRNTATTDRATGNESTDPDDGARTRFSIWDRRRDRDPDAESIAITAETSHAWWAQRENLELLVNPKKRGAEARARRAAEAAFAPPGGRTSRSRTTPGATRPAPGPEAGTTSGPTSMWDPAHVYSWSAPGDDPLLGAPGPSDETATDTSSTTPWDVLGLTSDASWEEVARRHKQLAKAHHPDRHAGDEDERRTAEARMSEINAAYADLRRIYQLTSGI
jgi:hypothetical protein